MDEQDEVFGEQRLDDQFRVVDGEVDDRGVELPREHSGDDRGGAALADDGVDPGVAFGDGAQELRHQPSGGGADDPDPGVARDVGVERGDVGGDVVDFVEDTSGPFDDPFAFVGQTAVGTVDEGDAELAFELRDVPGDVGLHGVEGSGGGGEGAVVGDGDDGGELSNIHVMNLSRKQMRSIGEFYLSDAWRRVHTFTNRTTREHPPCSASRRSQHIRSPTERDFQVETPRSPIGAFPVFR